MFRVAKESTKLLMQSRSSRLVTKSCHGGFFVANPSFSMFPLRSATGTFDVRHIHTSFDLPDPAAPYTANNKPYQLTKIVATIGPTSEQLEPLRQVVEAGMKIMRLNFSHATREEVELRTKNLALCQVSFFFLK